MADQCRYVWRTDALRITNGKVVNMENLDQMMNIGKEMKAKLYSIGIRSSKDLIHLGSKEAFIQLKEVYPNVCLVHLYALEGAILNIEYDKLPDQVKCDLKQFSDHLK